MSDAMQNKLTFRFLELSETIARMGFWELDPSTKIFKLSSGLRELLQVSNSQMEFSRFLAFFEEGERAKAEVALKALMDKGTTFSFDLGLRGADGRKKWVSFVGRSTNQDLPSLYGALKDLTERKSKEQLLAQLVENLPLAFFAKDVHNDFRFSGWNKHAEEIFGLKAEQVIGKNDYDFFPKDQADFFRKKDLEAIQKGKILQISEEPATLPTGEIRWLRTSKVCLTDFADSQHLLIGLSENITELKLRTKELEDNRVKMIESARLSSLGQMAAGISHEINNPLAIIYGKASVLKRKLKANNAPIDQIDEVEKIEETSDRIAKIIRGMKVFSKSSSHDPLVAASLTSLIQDAVEICGPRFQLNGVDLRLLVLHEIIFDCRPGHVSQILLNLLNNAFDAALSSPQKWVEIRSMISEGMLEISVADSGTGVAIEDREKIFEPFFTKNKEKGTGLGLSIAKLLAKEHSGDLILDTSSAQTKFVLRIPIHRELIKKVA